MKSPYLYMTKIKLLLSMTYRSEFFLGLFVQITLLFVSAFFWKAAYSGADTVAMVNERQMLTYSVIAIVLGNVFTVTIEGNLHGKVRGGNVAVDYIKPVNVFLMYFAEDIGNMVTAFVQRAVPVLICAALFVVRPLPYSPLHFVLFLISACFSFMILWMISALFGLLYFKTAEMGPMGAIKDYLIKILSGTFVPIWFFPRGAQTVLNYLPFIYTYQLPIGIFIGRSTIADAVKGITIQAAWLLFFAGIFIACKRRVEKNIFVQGG